MTDCTSSVAIARGTDRNGEMHARVVADMAHALARGRNVRACIGSDYD